MWWPSSFPSVILEIAAANKVIWCYFSFSIVANMTSVVFTVSFVAVKELCQTHRLTASDLVMSWVAFCHTGNKHIALNLENLDHFERDVNDRAPDCHLTSISHSGAALHKCQALKQASYFQRLSKNKTVVTPQSRRPAPKIYTIDTLQEAYPYQCCLKVFYHYHHYY